MLSSIATCKTNDGLKILQYRTTKHKKPCIIIEAIYKASKGGVPAGTQQFSLSLHGEVISSVEIYPPYQGHPVQEVTVSMKPTAIGVTLPEVLSNGVFKYDVYSRTAYVGSPS